MPSLWSLLATTAGLLLGQNLDNSFQRYNSSLNNFMNASVFSPALNAAAASTNNNYNQLTALLGIDPITLSTSVPSGELTRAGMLLPDDYLERFKTIAEQRFGRTASLASVIPAMAREAARRSSEAMLYLNSSDPATGETIPGYLTADGANARREAMDNLNQSQANLQDEVANNQVVALDNAMSAYGSGRSLYDQMPGVTAGGQGEIESAAQAAQAAPATQLVLKAMAKELAALGKLHGTIAEQQAKAAGAELDARREEVAANRTAAAVSMYNARLLTEILKSQVDAIEQQKLNYLALNQIGQAIDQKAMLDNWEQSNLQYGAANLVNLVSADLSPQTP